MCFVDARVSALPRLASAAGAGVWSLACLVFGEIGDVVLETKRL